MRTGVSGTLLLLGTQAYFVHEVLVMKRENQVIIRNWYDNRCDGTAVFSKVV